MRYFDREAVEQATPWPALIAALAEAFTSEHSAPDRHIHTIVVPDRDAGTALLMPAWIAGEHYGVKLANIFPSNGALGRPAVSALYVLFDAMTGEPLALMDGAAITERRTAATSALAASRLARADADTLLVVGAGRMAPMLVEAHRAVRPIRRTLVWARRPEQAAALAAAVDAVPAADLAEAVRAAGIVSAATLSREPVVLGQWLLPGQHLDLVGAFRPQMRETDAEAVARSTVFIDTEGGARAEAGDLLQAEAEGRFDWSDVAADLATLLGGRHPGRTSPDEITLFKSVGAAIEDLATARLVFAAHGDKQ